jgi:hypothetical protein
MPLTCYFGGCDLLGRIKLIANRYQLIANRYHDVYATLLNVTSFELTLHSGGFNS